MLLITKKTINISQQLSNALSEMHGMSLGFNLRYDAVVLKNLNKKIVINPIMARTNATYQIPVWLPFDLIKKTNVEIRIAENQFA